MNVEAKVLSEIKKTHTITSFSPSYSSSIPICKELMKYRCNNTYYKMFDDAVRGNKAIVKILLDYQTIDEEIWRYIPKEIRNKEFILWVLKQHDIYDFLNNYEKQNIEIILAAIMYRKNDSARETLKFLDVKKGILYQQLFNYPGALPYCINSQIITLHDNKTLMILKENISLIHEINSIALLTLCKEKIIDMILSNPTYYTKLPKVILNKFCDSDIIDLINTSPILYENLSLKDKEKIQYYQAYFINTL